MCHLYVVRWCLSYIVVFVFHPSVIGHLRSNPSGYKLASSLLVFRCIRISSTYPGAYNRYHPAYNLHDPQYDLHDPRNNLHDPQYNIHDPRYNFHDNHEASVLQEWTLEFREVKSEMKICFTHFGK